MKYERRETDYELRVLRQQLRNLEVSENKFRLAAEELGKLNRELEQQLADKTAQLETASRKLEDEIFKRKQVAESFCESEEKLSGILESIDDVVWSVSADTFEVLYINPSAEKTYGRPVKDFYLTPSLRLEVVHPDDREKTISPDDLIKKKGVDIEYRILRPDGEIRWLHSRARVVCGKTGEPVRIDGIDSDITGHKNIEEQLQREITEHRKTEEKIRYMSMTDELTGICNRRGFLTLAQQQIELAKRMGREIILLFADIDALKLINDNLGHEKGDMAIIDAANALKNTFRKSDIIARMGGDEFAVLALKTPKSDADLLVKRLQQQIDANNKREDRPYTLSLSVGMILYDTAYPRNIDELLSQADSLMYEQKRAKNNHAPAGLRPDLGK